MGQYSTDVLLCEASQQLRTSGAAADVLNSFRLAAPLSNSDVYLFQPPRADQTSDDQSPTMTFKHSQRNLQPFT